MPNFTKSGLYVKEQGEGLKQNKDQEGIAIFCLFIPLIYSENGLMSFLNCIVQKFYIFWKKNKRQTWNPEGNLRQKKCSYFLCKTIDFKI